MNKRKPVKDLIDLKLSLWYDSRKPIIKEAINKYPPGYYTFTGNGEEYLLVGWSEPNKKEEVVQIFLEREIEEGTERLRVHPKYVIKEKSLVGTEEVSLANIHHKPLNYILGKVTPTGTQYLKDADKNNRVFASIEACHEQLSSMNIPKEDFDKFVYTIV